MDGRKEPSWCTLAQDTGKRATVGLSCFMSRTFQSPFRYSSNASAWFLRMASTASETQGRRLAVIIPVLWACVRLFIYFVRPGGPTALKEHVILNQNFLSGVIRCLSIANTNYGCNVIRYASRFHTDLRREPLYIKI